MKGDHGNWPKQIKTVHVQPVPVMLEVQLRVAKHARASTNQAAIYLLGHTNFKIALFATELPVGQVSAL